MRAAAPRRLSTSASPASTPRCAVTTLRVVPRPSASRPLGAITVTPMRCVNPRPVRGSTIWEYRVPAVSRNCSVSPDVPTLMLLSNSSRLISRGWMLTFQPGFPGGASPIARSPLAATRARVIPRERSTRNASSAAYPFAMAPRSSCIPDNFNSTVPSLSTTFRYPTNRSARSRSSRSGTRFNLHSRVTGPIVTSNAPSESIASC
jgi:hypothetical protein